MKWLFAGVILFCYSFCIAQNRKLTYTDSLELKIKSLKPGDARTAAERLLFRAYINSVPQKALAVATMGLHDAEQLHNDTDKCIFYGVIGEANVYLQNNKGAMHYLRTDYELASKIGFKFEIAHSQEDLGKIYQDQSDFVTCQTYYFKALTIFEELKNFHHIAVCNYNIGATYSNQFDYKKAAFYAERALEASKKSAHKTMVPVTYLLLGDCMSNLKNYPDARKYYTSALEIFQKKQDDYSSASALSLLAMAYPGAYTTQLDFAFRAKKLLDKIAPDDFYAVTNLGNIGCIYGQMARAEKEPGKRAALFKNARLYLLKSIDKAKKTNTKSAIIDYSDSLSVIDATLGNYKDAYSNIIVRNTLYDSVYSQNTKNKIASLEGKHEIELRDKQLLINRLEIENEHKERWFLITGIVVLLIIAGLIYYQNIQRKKTNTTLLHLNGELDEANKVKTRFFSILNHDLRSPVASFVNFLHLQQEAPDLLDEASRAAYSTKAKASAENLLTTMEDLLLWSKGQMENFKPSTKEVAVSLLFNYLKQSVIPAENVVIRYEQQQDMKLMVDEHYLKTIMYNLTNNSVKALRNGGTIIWKAWAEGGQQYLSITDNGPGATTDAFKALYDESAPIGIASGLGLHIIRDLAKAIGCKISVSAKPHQGVAITLQLA